MTDLSRLRGSIPPLITPFRDGAVDLDTYARIVEFQITRGSHGILINGTTSEPSTLTVAERNALVDCGLRTAAGRVPVVAATGSQSLAETKDLTAHAAAKGVDALLIVTPYYIKPSQRGLIEYYIEATRGIDVPWMIYHIPGRTAVSVTLETVVELARRSPTFVLGALPDFKIFVGLEELSFPMMAIGAVGLMNAVGNLNPRAVADIAEAVEAGDLARGRLLHQQLLEVNKSVFYDTNPTPIKYMMKRLGIIPENEHRLPMVAASPELQKRLDGVLERSGLMNAPATSA
jgi:4-hydroxy-tetrahydrodipicolinate synthase